MIWKPRCEFSTCTEGMPKSSPKRSRVANTWAEHSRRLHPSQQVLRQSLLALPIRSNFLRSSDLALTERVLIRLLSRSRLSARMTLFVRRYFSAEKRKYRRKSGCSSVRQVEERFPIGPPIA